MILKENLLDLFEKTLDLVCIVNKPGWLLKVNPAVVKTLGYSEEELLKRPVSELIHPDDREKTAKRRTELLNDEPLLNFQNRYITKSGCVVWLEWTSVYVPEKEVVFAIAKNITARKEVELAIEENFKKYKELASHFKHHIEKERRSFAVELHEELAQMATAVKMDLDWIASGPCEMSGLVKERMDHAMGICQSLIARIRKLSYSVGASEISELGLVHAINSLRREFTSVTGVPCSFEDSFDETTLDYDVKLDLFRICQEALLNVMQHSEATEVKIRVEDKEDNVVLSVTDNGKGFDHTTAQNFGMRNMQGRADYMNGELIIDSGLDKGTVVTIRVNPKAEA